MFFPKKACINTIYINISLILASQLIEQQSFLKNITHITTASLFSHFCTLILTISTAFWFNFAFLIVILACFTYIGLFATSLTLQWLLDIIKGLSKTFPSYLTYFWSFLTLLTFGAYHVVHLTHVSIIYSSSWHFIALSFAFLF